MAILPAANTMFDAYTWPRAFTYQGKMAAMADYENAIVRDCFNAVLSDN
ncbi:hypothetical protein [Rhizobium phage RHEph12]|nr:hypothetical protein [Rhizobium phage RHEph12]